MMSQQVESSQFTGALPDMPKRFMGGLLKRSLDGLGNLLFGPCRIERMMEDNRHKVLAAIGTYRPFR